MTTTMAETFDAPMADSGDIDMSMYSATMATTDSWLSAEASMGDVTFSTEAATFDYVQDGIEIEMLDDDEAITEYEMADEGEMYYDHELQDSSVSPLVDVPDLTVDTHAEDPEHPHPPSDGGVLVPLHSHTSLEPAVDSSFASSGLEVASQLETHPLDSHALDEHAMAHGDAVPSPIVVPDAPQPDVAAVADEGVPSVAQTMSIPPEHLREANLDDDRPDTGAQLAPASPLDDNHVSVEHVPEGDVLYQGGPHIEEDGSTEPVAETSDPHEISEGVYIDPPPPVLLSLPRPTERAQYCLFNLPVSSTPHSPSDSKSDDTAEPLALLLQDRPTLYYEPLSAVFEALRGESCVQNLPGGPEAELVLDAYELELAVSEDNVYAHEVTLHELNVLHDGSDLHGPLRLKLKVYTPRFVTRYHILREQIARLNITADGDDSHQIGSDPDRPHEHNDDVAQLPLPDKGDDGGEGATHETYQETADEHLEIDQSENDAAFQEPPVTASDPVDGPTSTADLTAESINNDPSRSIMDELDRSIASEGALVEASAAGSGQEGEDPPPNQIAENEDGAVLEANEVHEQSDAGEAGDYADEHFPDDEDEFGDDLPEDLAGQTQGGEYTHPGGGEGTSTHSTDVGDEAVYVPESGIKENSSEDPALVSVPEGVEDNPEGSDGLDTNEHTDTYHNFTSADDPEDQLEDGDDVLDLSHEHLQHTEPDSQVREESATLSSEDEDGLIDDWEDEDSPVVEPAAPAEQSDLLSHKSSTTTLASKTSKRTYDEVELDDFDDDPSLVEAASSPGTHPCLVSAEMRLTTALDTKRARVQ
ncbi:hypothetical protein C8Q78DRAFT_1036777 [Trametes maxima]|nr:hypothetical protein C8Q78DRAFT_1036777 [Trametes maxima]